MSEGTANIYTVFVMGMSVAWIVLEVVRRLPFDDYVKVVLLVILPLPLFGIGLVAVFLGPASFREAAAEQSSPASILKTFMSGAFWAVVILGLLHTFLFMREEE